MDPIRVVAIGGSKDDLRPVGYLRGERISKRMMEKMALLQADRAQVTS